MRGQQIEIYLHFLKTFKHETAWFSFLDIDEFLVLKGVDNIARFMREYEMQVDCLYFNWVVYGNSGKVRREDGPTLTSYLRREATPDGHTKMLCRSAAIDAAAIERGYAMGRGAFHHFLDNYRLPGVRCRDVLLGSTDGYSANFGTSEKPFIQRDGFAEAVLKRAYIAHFQFRSEEDFIRRWRRGGFSQDEMWRGRFRTGYAQVDPGAAQPRLRHLPGRVLAPLHGACDARRDIRAVLRAAGRECGAEQTLLAKFGVLPVSAAPTLGRTAGGGNNGVRTGDPTASTRTMRCGPGGSSIC